MTPMDNYLDFDDIANTLFLDIPGNAELANIYISENLLCEAEAYPELRKMPATGNLIALAHLGEYEPLTEIEEQEAEFEKTCETWSKTLAEELNPEEQIDLETLLQKLEVISETPELLDEIEKPDRVKICQLGASYRCIKYIHLTALLLREHCSNIVKAIYELSEEMDMEPDELVYWQICRDEVLKRAYPTKDAAGLYLINTNMSNLHIIKSILTMDGICRGLMEENDSPPEENLPTLQEIGEALAIDRQYIISELDRIYGSQDS